MTEESPIRTTVFFDPILHRVLCTKAAETDCSISDLVNDAVKQVFAEDAEDFKAFDAREQEADFAFENVVIALKRRGQI